MAECGDVWMSRKVDEGQSYNNRILAFSSAFTFARWLLDCWRSLPGCPKAPWKWSFPQVVGALIFFTEQWALLFLLTSLSSRRHAMPGLCVSLSTSSPWKSCTLLLWHSGMRSTSASSSCAKSCSDSENVIFFQEVWWWGRVEGWVALFLFPGGFSQDLALRQRWGWVSSGSSTPLCGFDVYDQAQLESLYFLN